MEDTSIKYLRRKWLSEIGALLAISAALALMHSGLTTEWETHPKAISVIYYIALAALMIGGVAYLYYLRFLQEKAEARADDVRRRSEIAKAEETLKERQIQESEARRLIQAKIELVGSVTKLIQTAGLLEEDCKRKHDVWKFINAQILSTSQEAPGDHQIEEITPEDSPESKKEDGK